MKMLDRLALTGMGLSLLVLLQPWWSGGLRAGFFGTLATVIAPQISCPRVLDSRADRRFRYGDFLGQIAA